MRWQRYSTTLNAFQAANAVRHQNKATVGLPACTSLIITPALTAQCIDIEWLTLHFHASGAVTLMQQPKMKPIDQSTAKVLNLNFFRAFSGTSSTLSLRQSENDMQMLRQRQYYCGRVLLRARELEAPARGDPPLAAILVCPRNSQQTFSGSRISSELTLQLNCPADSAAPTCSSAGICCCCCY